MKIIKKLIIPIQTCSYWGCVFKPKYRDIRCLIELTNSKRHIRRTKMKDKAKQYRPQLGKKVYCVYCDDCIIVEEVGYIGKESFIIADFSDCNNFDSFEWYYEDYNITWFTNLEKAKKKLLEVAYREENEKLKVVKVSDTYYEAREYER